MRHRRGLRASVPTGPLIALRADIDALPLADEKAVPYRSTVEGMCHGCGHDAHTAILLGAARELAQSPPAHGRVRLIFQPAEETLPGGAHAAVKAGVLDGVSQIYALHCDPRLRHRPDRGAGRARSPPPATTSRSGCSAPAGTPPART